MSGPLVSLADDKIVEHGHVFLLLGKIDHKLNLVRIARKAENMGTSSATPIPTNLCPLVSVLVLFGDTESPKVTSWLGSR